MSPVAALPPPAVSQDVALAIDEAFEVRVTRRLTNASRAIYVTVNAGAEVTVNGKVVA